MMGPEHSLFSLLRSDLAAKAAWVYGKITRRTMLKAVLTDGTLAMILYRLMQASQKHGLRLLAMVFNKLNTVVCRCIIGRRAQFGPGFVLIHSQGVVVNSQVVGGDGLKLEHEVTIGAEKGECPILGDNIFVGAGAKIIGRVTVGNNVKIGANTVVLEDVPDGATVVGSTARVIVRSDD